MRILLFLGLFGFLLACNGDDSGSTTNAQVTSNPVSTYTPPPAGDIISPEPEVGAEAPNIQFKITGGQPGMARMIGFFTDQRYKADSAMVGPSGDVVLKRDKPYRTGLYFMLLPGDKSFQFIVDKDQTFTMRVDLKDPMRTMQVEGSKDNQLLYETMNWEAQNRLKFNATNNQLKNAQQGSPDFQRLTEEKNKLLAERKAYLNNVFSSNPNSFYAKYKSAGQNPEVQNFYNADGTEDLGKRAWTYRRNFWANVDFADGRLLNTPMIANKLKKYINELTLQNPDSLISSARYLVDRALPYPEYFKYFANWIVINFDPLETTLMDPQAVYVFMIQNYFTKERAFWSDSVEVFGLQQRAYEMAQSLVGQQGPDITVNDLNGTPRRLYDMKEPYLIVYMFNPDCEHCAVQTPELVKWYPGWRGKVGVYAIAVDTEEPDWRAYINKQGMQNFTNVRDPTNRSIYATYYVDHTPELYVLNPERKIIAKNLKVFQIQEMIAKDGNRF